MKQIDANTLRAIHKIFECGLALTDKKYTDEQIADIIERVSRFYR